MTKGRSLASYLYEYVRMSIRAIKCPCSLRSPPSMRAAYQHAIACPETKKLSTRRELLCIADLTLDYKPALSDSTQVRNGRISARRYPEGTFFSIIILHQVIWGETPTFRLRTLRLLGLRSLVANSSEDFYTKRRIPFRGRQRRHLVQIFSAEVVFPLLPTGFNAFEV